MPIHEYACHACGREFEALVRSNAQPACPACGSTDLDKKLSVFATAQGGREPAPMAAGPCGTCGHPDGPGSCQVH
jgi:putative FmdB family regulatory protein